MSNFLTVLIVAISLSMDTFSLSMAYGMLKINRKEIIKISIFVGMFHFIMPMIGNSLGNIIIKLININPSIIVGIVFLSIAIQLIFSLSKDDELQKPSNFISIIVFSFSVSIDSFSTGIGLGAFSKNIFLPLITFMIVSSTFTYLGLNFGNKIFHVIGKKAQIVGIVLLMILSINYIIKGC